MVELDDDGDEVAHMNIERAFPVTSECEVTEDEGSVDLTITITDAVQALDGGFVGAATVTFAHHYDEDDDGGKFDVIVEAWPWQGGGELALDFFVTSDQYTIEAAENGLGFTNGDGEDAGHVDWALNATARYEDEHEEEAIVDSAVEIVDDGHTANVRLQYTEASDGYVELVHDPWMGNDGWFLWGGWIFAESMVPFEVPKLVWDKL